MCVCYIFLISRAGMCLAYIGFRIIVHYISRISVISQQELARLKIERELRTSYIVEAKKAETFAKASKTLVAKLPRHTKTCQRLGTRN